MESKYSYAFDRNSNLVNINDLDRKSTKFGEIFFCLGCNNPLIPRLGKIKIKHFAHKHIEVSCSYESYLHKLSKTVFFNEYTKCLSNNLPFNITILKKSSCNFYREQYDFTCQKNETITYDLIKYFDLISIEKSFNGFIPDILLQSSKSDKHLFVEFAVSHKCDENKLKSDNKIIEFDVKSEEDLNYITSHNLNYSSSNINFFNFKQKNYNYSCEGNCDKHKICVFVLYSSQKAVIEHTLPKYIYKFRNKKDIVFYEILGILQDKMEFRNVYINKLLNSFYLKNLPVKNCFLCRYHAFSPIEGSPIFCKAYQKSHNSVEAIKCEAYIPINSLCECKKVHYLNEMNMNKYSNHIYKIHYGYY